MYFLDENNATLFIYCLSHVYVDKEVDASGRKLDIKRDTMEANWNTSIFTFTIFGFVVLATVLAAQTSSFRPQCQSLFSWVRDPDDCSHFWRCVWGSPYEMPRCPEGQVLNSAHHVCALRGSPYDNCDTWETLTLDPVAEQCSRNPTTFLPHPSNCHQYYNCSGNSNLYPSRPDPDSANFYLYECTYPQLFNKNTLRCEDYRQVQCGERFEPVDKCEYIQYQCRGPNCIPCNVYSPSCKDLPDGPDVYRGREWTPYFSICQDQRLVNTSTCPRDEILNVARLFSPVRRECQNLYGIPVEHGGYFLNCTGRPDGLYSDDVTNRPNLYFRCDSGVQTRIYLCPDGQRFYQQTSSCTSLV
ncbi:hypothetical protein C0Q70_15411 [Pomacea canaliculata]|uniref:Chitin-binding type-2 domain-containing protein n=1 Tax=Pomacea canaliculata TaxID=400727 RepID=A0A2T7NUQ8_POMCA|nr:hypothetical protein C0Q70_15411 [Pomacea canaliculata]